jgi:Zn-dependent oligopeptidase
MTNPLNDLSSLPQFSAIKPEHIQPAIEKAIQACKTKITEILSQSVVHEQFVHNTPLVILSYSRLTPL